jgi:hypothetical protein
MKKNPEQDFDDLVNQGEGNKTAARGYNRDATEHARSGDVEREAEEAREAVDSQGDELQRAEDEGKRHIAEEDPELGR